MTTTKTRILKAIALLAASLTLCTSGLSQSAEIVYNNTTSPLGQQYISDLEFGDQVTLDGQNRLLSQFQFEYFTSLTPAASKQGILSIYQNNGTGGAPSTLVFESNPITLLNGFNQVVISGISGVTLPTTFTWTVKFAGLTGTETAGLLLYDPPSIGSSADDFWQKNAFGAWGLQRLQGGNINANFSAKIAAVPEPSAVQIVMLAGVCYLGLAAFRRHSQKAT